MSHLSHIDFIVGLVGTDPFDPDDRLLKIDRYHEAIVVAFNVEDDPLRVDDARRRIAAFYIRCIFPGGLARFVEPGLQCSLDSRLVLAAGKTVDELSQGATGDDSHSPLTIMVPLWEQGVECTKLYPNR